MLSRMMIYSELNSESLELIKDVLASMKVQNDNITVHSPLLRAEFTRHVVMNYWTDLRTDTQNCEIFFQLNVGFKHANPVRRRKQNVVPDFSDLQIPVPVPPTAAIADRFFFGRQV